MAKKSQAIFALNTAGMFKHHCSLYSFYDISDLLLKQAARANIIFDKSFIISKRCPQNYPPAKFKLTSLSHTSILSTSQSYKHASDKVDIFSTKCYRSENSEHITVHHNFSFRVLLDHVIQYARDVVGEHSWNSRFNCPLSYPTRSKPKYS